MKNFTLHNTSFFYLGDMNVITRVVSESGATWGVVSFDSNGVTLSRDGSKLNRTPSDTLTRSLLAALRESTHFTKAQQELVENVCRGIIATNWDFIFAAE